MVPKTCLHCESPLPEPRAGRGGKQAARKFCSITCKSAHRCAGGRKPSEVTCEKCGRSRTLLHPKLAGRMCQHCAQEMATSAASLANSKELSERFMSKVQKTETCWLWQGTVQPNGYGAFTVSEGQTLRAHRWSYEYHVGPIPEGLQIDHVVKRGCFNRSCVNPAHLEPVTAQENTRRAMRSHCVNGHAFTEENVYMHGGKRYCRTCRRSRGKAWQAKQR